MYDYFILIIFIYLKLKYLEYLFKTMFISYTFAYVYLCLSLAGFIKDIFLKIFVKSVY